MEAVQTYVTHSTVYLIYMGLIHTICRINCFKTVEDNTCQIRGSLIRDLLFYRESELDDTDLETLIHFLCTE